MTEIWLIKLISELNQENNEWMANEFSVWIGSQSKKEKRILMKLMNERKWKLIEWLIAEAIEIKPINVIWLIAALIQFGLFALNWLKTFNQIKTNWNQPNWMQRINPVN